MLIDGGDVQSLGQGVCNFVKCGQARSAQQHPIVEALIAITFVALIKLACMRSFASSKSAFVSVAADRRCEALLARWFVLLALFEPLQRVRALPRRRWLYSDVLDGIVARAWASAKRTLRTASTASPIRSSKPARCCGARFPCIAMRDGAAHAAYRCCWHSSSRATL